MEYQQWEIIKKWIVKRQEISLRVKEMLKSVGGDIKEVKDKTALMELERQKTDIKQVYLSMPKFIYYTLGGDQTTPLFKWEKEELRKEMKTLEII